MNERADRFPLVEPLRAVAALSILAFHASFFAAVDIPGGALFRQMASRLDVGVTIFFVLSGFLLYRPFVRARLGPGPMPRVGGYLWRRSLRIAPAYWVALVVVALWLGIDGVLTPSGVLRYFGFAQIYDSRTALGGMGQAWTLCVEVSFYLFLPVWAVLLARMPTRGDRRRVLAVEVAGLAGLFLFSSLYKVWALGQVDPTQLDSTQYLMPLPNFLDQFALGMGVAVLSAWYEGREDLPRPLALLRRQPALPWIVALVAFYLAATQIGYDGGPVQQVSRIAFVLRHELYSVVALGAILPALFAEPGRGLVGRVLGGRVLAYLGLVSYGIYLYHFVVLDQLFALLGSELPASIAARLTIYLTLGVLGTTLLASISYYAVERPALSLKWPAPSPRPAARVDAIDFVPAEPEPTPAA
jgi:peptidoglycan/LPS O-acetylase OafA/YrhL